MLAKILPLLLTQRASIALPDPLDYAAVMKGVVTFSPNNSAIACLVLRLADQAGLHDVCSANSAHVRVYIPFPEGDEVPFLHLKEGTRLVCWRCRADG